MRIHGIAIVGLIMLSATASAQPPVLNVNAVLGDWEKAMADVRTLSCVVKRVMNDSALGSKEEFHGFALYAKADQKNATPRARLDLTKVTNKESHEWYICADGKLFEYSPAAQALRVRRLPMAKQQDSFLWLLFNDLSDLLRHDRCTITPDEKAHEQYHVLWFEPKADKDKTMFTKARLCLYKSNNMPAEISYVQPNRVIMTWSFTKLSLNQPIAAEHLQPELPKPWHYEEPVERKLPPPR